MISRILIEGLVWAGLCTSATFLLNRPLEKNVDELRMTLKDQDVLLRECKIAFSMV